jgi:DNA-binding MarR family transcriptional regulator
MSTRANDSSFIALIAELHRAVHAIGLFLDARLGGSLSQAEALAVLHLSTLEPSSVNSLHRAFLHRRSTLTSVLDRLEKKGLVRRVPAQRDRRTVGLALTPKGRRAAGEITSAFAELYSAVESSNAFGERETACMRTLAEKAAALAAIPLDDV